MTYKRYTVAQKTDKTFRVYAGHIKKHTAIKHGFLSVALCIFDASGKGRSETRHFYPPFNSMAPFN